MPIRLRRAWFWGPHYEIEKPHLFHFVFLVNHNRIVNANTSVQGISSLDRRLVWAWVHTGYEPWHPPARGVYSKRQATSHPLDATTRKLRNTKSPTYNMPQKCCAAGPQKSRRPTQQALRMISHILQLRISNIYAQATSTIFSIHAHMHFQQHLLYCPIYHGLNIYCPAPRIAGYQSPFPFVCASWTGV